MVKKSDFATVDKAAYHGADYPDGFEPGLRYRDRHGPAG